MRGSISWVTGTAAVTALVAMFGATALHAAPATVNGINVSASADYDDLDVDVTPGVVADTVDSFATEAVVDWTTFVAGSAGTEVELLGAGATLMHTSDLADYAVLNRIITPGVDSPVRIDGSVDATILSGAVTGGTVLFSSAAGIVWGPAHTSSVTSIPSGVTAVAGDGSGEVAVSWTAGDTTTLAPLTGYRVMQRAGGGPWTPAIANTGTTATTANLSGLTDGTSYEFRVHALAHLQSSTALAGETPPSPTSNTVTPSAPPTATVSAATGQANPTNALPVAFELEFSEAVDDLVVGDLSFGGDVTVTTASVSRTSSTTFDVSVTSATGEGALTLTVPAGATDASAGNMQPNTVSSPGSVSIDTTAPVITIDQVAPQTDPATSLPIVLSIEVSEPVTDLVDSDVVTSAGAGTLTGSGMSYTYTVSSNAGAGPVIVTIAPGAATDAAGNPSTTTVVDNQVALGVPGPPIGAAATAADGEATVSWTSPPNGGSTISSYRIESSTDDGASWTDAATVAAPSTSVNVGSLTNGTTIQFRVAAINAVGDGAPSAASAAVMPLSAPGVSLAAATASSMSPIEVVITFTDDVTGFDVGDMVIGGTSAVGPPSLAGSGNRYVLSVSPTTDGSLTIGVPAGVAVNVNGTPNAASSGVTIDVDTLAPVISVPTATVTATAEPGDPDAAVAYVVTVVDQGGPAATALSFDAAPSLTCTPASGTRFDIGTTTVNCEASDAAGNTAMASFVVEVLAAPQVTTTTAVTATTAVTTTTTVPATVPPTDVELPATGGSESSMMSTAALCALAGAVLIGLTRRRRLVIDNH